MSTEYFIRVLCDIWKSHHPDFEVYTAKEPTYYEDEYVREGYLICTVLVDRKIKTIIDEEIKNETEEKQKVVVNHILDTHYRKLLESLRTGCDE